VNGFVPCCFCDSQCFHAEWALCPACLEKFGNPKNNAELAAALGKHGVPRFTDSCMADVFPTKGVQ
jgi:hypothetical protein